MRLNFAKWFNEESKNIPDVIAQAVRDPLVNAMTPMLAQQLQQPLTKTLNTALKDQLKPVVDQLNFLKTQANKPQTPQPNKPGDALINKQEIKTSTTKPTPVDMTKSTDTNKLLGDLTKQVANMAKGYFGNIKVNQ